MLTYTLASCSTRFLELGSVAVAAASLTTSVSVVWRTRTISRAGRRTSSSLEVSGGRSSTSHDDSA